MFSVVIINMEKVVTGNFFFRKSLKFNWKNNRVNINRKIGGGGELILLYIKVYYKVVRFKIVW